VLRRERRALLKFREERLRDLGGLLLEMFRRDHFREDLVRERCQELLEVDDQLAAIDSLLGLSWTPPEPARCACGAPLGEDARFCATCGRSVGPAPRHCAACGNGLTEDAAFCTRCGPRTDARAVRKPLPAAELEAAGPGPEPAAEAAES
jgi:predicted nucleic acid-binding Zn ribbon protein